MKACTSTWYKTQLRAQSEQAADGGFRGADKGKGLTLGAALSREGGALVYKMWAHNGTQARTAPLRRSARLSPMQT